MIFRRSRCRVRPVPVLASVIAAVACGGKVGDKAGDSAEGGTGALGAPTGGARGLGGTSSWQSVEPTGARSSQPVPNSVTAGSTGGNPPGLAGIGGSMVTAGGAPTVPAGAGVAGVGGLPTESGGAGPAIESTCTPGVQAGDYCNPAVDMGVCERSDRACVCAPEEIWVCVYVNQSQAGAGGQAGSGAGGDTTGETTCVAGVQSGDECDPNVDIEICERSDRDCECQADETWLCTPVGAGQAGAGGEPAIGGAAGAGGKPAIGGAAGAEGEPAIGGAAGAGGQAPAGGAGNTTGETTCVPGVQTGDYCNPAVDTERCERSAWYCDCQADETWLCTPY